MDNASGWFNSLPFNLGATEPRLCNDFEADDDFLEEILEEATLEAGFFLIPTL